MSMYKWEKIKFVGGNIKLGNMGSFSKLYGNDTFSTPYGNVKGSCGNHCEGCKKECYVRKSYRYGSVIKNHAKNTLAFRYDMVRAFADLHAQLTRKRKPFDVIRINQSGEIESTEELMSWCALAFKHKESKFYIYTKNYISVYETINAIGQENIPDNFTILISIWHENGIFDYKLLSKYSFIKAFVYDDGFEYAAYDIKPETGCFAYDSNGKLDHNITCDKCRKCFNRTHKVIFCTAH